jgi:hypothetical protein
MKGKRLTAKEIEEMAELRSYCTIKDIAEYLHITERTVIKYTYGVPYKDRRRVDYNRVLKLYFIQCLSYSMIAKRFGNAITRQGIYRIIKVHGEDYVRQNPKGLQRTAYQSQKRGDVKSNRTLDRRGPNFEGVSDSD